ncbi:MAG: hypothetical protein AB1609_16990 [Bacillota bacterium]
MGCDRSPPVEPRYADGQRCAHLLKGSEFLAKAAPDPAQLLDRRRRGAVSLELHTTADVVEESVHDRALGTLAEARLRVLVVHSPTELPDAAGPCGVGSPDERRERLSLELIRKTVALADRVIPPGRPRYVIIHWGTDVRLADLGLNRAGHRPLHGELGLPGLRQQALEQASRSLLTLAEFCEERARRTRASYVLCLENKPLFRPGFWTPEQSVVAVAGRLPEDSVDVLSRVSARNAPGDSVQLRIALDTVHLLTVCRGLRWMASFGQPFALFTEEDVAQHASLTPEAFIATLSPLTAVVHLANAIGLADSDAEHGAPFADVSDVLPLLRALDAGGFLGPVTLEVREQDPCNAVGLELTARTVAIALGRDPFTGTPLPPGAEAAARDTSHPMDAVAAPGISLPVAAMAASPVDATASHDDGRPAPGLAGVLGLGSLIHAGGLEGASLSLRPNGPARPSDLTAAEQFLLEEFREAGENMRAGFEERDRMINFYLSILTALLGLTGYLVLGPTAGGRGESRLAPIAAAGVAMLGSLFVLVVGWFVFSAYLRIRVNSNNEQNARIAIRRYFAGQKLPGDEPVRRYLRHPAGWLPALNVSGVNYARARTVIFANNVAAAMGAGAATYCCCLITRLPVWLWLVVSALAFVGVWVVQERVYRRVLGGRDREALLTELTRQLREEGYQVDALSEALCRQHRIGPPKLFRHTSTGGVTCLVVALRFFGWWQKRYLRRLTRYFPLIIGVPPDLRPNVALWLDREGLSDRVTLRPIE